VDNDWPVSVIVARVTLGCSFLGAFPQVFISNPACRITAFVESAFGESTTLHLIERDRMLAIEWNRKRAFNSPVFVSDLTDLGRDSPTTDSQRGAEKRGCIHALPCGCQKVCRKRCHNSPLTVNTRLD
jgi:hypothetical protein